MTYPISSAALASRLEAGLQAHRNGDIERAVEIYRQLLAGAPDHPDALRLLGTALLQLGAPEEAVSYLERAARRQSKDPHLLANLAQAYLALRRYPEAGSTFRKASRLAPNEAQLHVGIAAAAAMEGKLAEARSALLRYAERFPRAPLVWLNLGNVLRDTNEAEPAIHAYRKALELDPLMAEAHNSLGSILHALRRFAEAEQAYRACIGVAPDFLLPRYNLASLVMQTGRFSDAEQILREIVRRTPEAADAHRDLGACLSHQRRLLEALACYRRAVELSPNDAITAQTYGGALAEIGETANGLRSLARAAALDPHSLALKRASAGAMLAHGMIGEGWRYHAARSGAAELRREYGAWDPDGRPAPPLAQLRVCVVGEQGLGDELFFFRYALELARRGAHVTYRASPRLRSLLGRASGFGELREQDERSPPPDVNVLAGDLPLLLGYAEASALALGVEPHHMRADPERRISIFSPPLAPSLDIAALPERVADMRARLAAAGPPPYVGITWRGGVAPQDQTGAEWVLFKSIAPAALATALRGVRATVVSLQRLPQEEEMGALASALGRPVLDLADANEDLEDALALVSVIDEYVGVSNTNMHLRAAAGRTARVLVPVPAEWRWMQSGAASPWFPGFAIYRQSLQGDWSPALDRLARDLEANYARIT